MATDPRVRWMTLIDEAADLRAEHARIALLCRCVERWREAGLGRVPTRKAEEPELSVLNAQELLTHTTPEDPKCLFRSHIEISLTQKKHISLLLWLKYCSYLLKRET